MIISRRTLFESVGSIVAASSSLSIRAACAQELTLNDWRARELALLKPSKKQSSPLVVMKAILQPDQVKAGESPFVTTVGFEQLARDSRTQLATIRRSVCIITAMSKATEQAILVNDWAKVASLWDEGQTVHMGSGTYYGGGVVGFDAHEIEKAQVHYATFCPEPGKIYSSVIDINPSKIFRDIDIGFGRIAQLDSLDRQGVLPVRLSSWADTTNKDLPVIVTGFFDGKLHASSGLPLGYQAQIKMKGVVDETTIVPLSCKMKTSHYTHRGMSGGPTSSGTNIVGICDGLGLDKTGKIVATQITPIEPVVIAFTREFPDEAASVGLRRPNASWLETFNRQQPECMPR